MSDTISRAAARETFCALCNGKRFGDCEYSNTCQSLRALQCVPPTEPERPKEEWRFIGNNMFECSSCRVAYTTEQLDGLRNYASDPYAPKFCPNCGCDMRMKGADDEDN